MRTCASAARPGSRGRTRARRRRAARVPLLRIRRAQRVRVRPGEIREGLRRARAGAVRGALRGDRDRAAARARAGSSDEELALGDGLSLMRGDAVADAPAEAIWGNGEEPNVLAVLTVAHDRTAPSPVSTARARFRRILTALRLFERGGYALGPIGWARTDTGAWRTVALGSSGRPRFVTFISAEHEDELRAFCNLIARRAPTAARSRGRWRASRWGASGSRRSSR